MNMSKLLQSKRKGSVIVLVMLVVVILLAAGVGLLSLGLSSRIFSIRSASDISARCAVDAGLTKALFQMNKKLETNPWDDSTLPQATNETLPNSDATYSYTVTGDLSSGFSVESIGKSNQAEKKASSSLQLQGPFESALFTQQNLILKASTLVDGYNSSDPGITNVKLKIGTNSILANSVVLNSGVIVDGDVLIGVGGDIGYVIQDLGATTNAKYAVPQEIVFEPIIVPALPDKGAGISVHGSTLTLGPADSGTYGQISLKRATNPAVLEIAGGDVVLHITGGIGMGQGCEIMVSEDASLTLYLDGNLLAGNEAGINNKNKPSKFKLYGTGGVGQELDLKAKGSFFGAVYAPNADIVINTGGDIYGSFVSSSFELKSGGNLYYDEVLKTVSVNDTAVRFVLKHWHEQ
jgi:Tfp pilus assembly protein PilX